MSEIRLGSEVQSENGDRVFAITANCGHYFEVWRRPTTTVQRFAEVYGAQDLCPECHKKALKDIVDEANYRRDPDGPDRGYDLLFGSQGSISGTTRLIR